MLSNIRNEEKVGSWIPQTLVCADESVDYRSYTASGTGRRDTNFEADPVSGSRHLGTFPARGEVSTPPERSLPEHLGESSLVLDLSETRLCR